MAFGCSYGLIVILNMALFYALVKISVAHLAMAKAHSRIFYSSLNTSTGFLLAALIE